MWASCPQNADIMYACEDAGALDAWEVWLRRMQEGKAFLKAGLHRLQPQRSHELMSELVARLASEV